MAKSSLALSAHPVPIPETDLEHVSEIAPGALQLSGRLQRGLELAEERFDEIVRVAPYVWEVPSCSGNVTYTANLKIAACNCPDRPPEPERCKHVSAAAYKKAKTVPCAGCGKRFRHIELVDVMDWHESLVFFEGDAVCASCALANGLL